jgi:hypothetical protein
MHSGCDAGDPPRTMPSCDEVISRPPIRPAAIKDHCTGWRRMKQRPPPRRTIFDDFRTVLWMISYGLPHTANEQDSTDQLGTLTEAARLGRGESQKNASRRRPRRLCAVLRHRLLAAAAGAAAGLQHRQAHGSRFLREGVGLSVGRTQRGPPTKIEEQGQRFSRLLIGPLRRSSLLVEPVREYKTPLSAIFPVPSCAACGVTRPRGASRVRALRQGAGARAPKRRRHGPPVNFRNRERQSAAYI